jgi:hypothetical protein
MLRFGKLSTSAHTRMPWRIHAIANDFRVEDVWALPTPGALDDFPRLVELMESFDPAETSPVVRALFSIRWRLGGWLGLDRGDAGLDARVPSLRERLPADMGGDVDLAVRAELPFRPVYVTDREAAFEIANETMHGVLHLGWVPEGAGGYCGQMAVLVKPNGPFGRAYMAAIAPFRYALVYPMMMRAIARRWRATARQVTVPADIRDLSTLPTIDYADAFLVDTGAHPDWTAERWAVAVLEDAPPAMRARLLAGWSALGLRDAERSDPSVLGWEVRGSSADAVLLGRSSRIGMPGELLFALRPEGLLLATFVYHQTVATRAMWAAVERIHVGTVLALLDRAARDPSSGVTASDQAGVG